MDCETTGPRLCPFPSAPTPVRPTVRRTRLTSLIVVWTEYHGSRVARLGPSRPGMAGLLLKPGSSKRRWPLPLPAHQRFDLAMERVAVCSVAGACPGWCGKYAGILILMMGLSWELILHRGLGRSGLLPGPAWLFISFSFSSFSFSPGPVLTLGGGPESGLLPSSRHASVPATLPASLLPLHLATRVSRWITHSSHTLAPSARCHCISSWVRWATSAPSRSIGGGGPRMCCRDCTYCSAASGSGNPYDV